MVYQMTHHMLKKKVKDIKELYINKLHDELSLANIETRIVTNKETKELNKKVAESDAKIKALTNENTEKDKQIEELTQLVNQTREEIAQTNKVVEELQLKREKSDIRNIINDYFYENYRDDTIKKEFDKDGEKNIGHKKCVVICELAYEIALDNKSEFSADKEYLDRLIKKAIVKCSFNPDMIIPKYNEIQDKNIQFHDITGTINDIVSDVIIILANHEDIWDMIKENQKTIKTIIINHIQNSNYDIKNITSENKQTIAEEVIMEYLTKI